MNESHEDRLIDVLLEEVAGDAAPPDLADRILEAAEARRPRRRRWLAPVSVAAALAVVAGLWVILYFDYPEPRARGSFTVASGEGVGRGSTVESAAGEAEIELGGYVRAVLDAGSEARIVGRPRDEAIELRSGGVTCFVDGSVGRFTVYTEVGKVSTAGTTFRVRVLEPEGDSLMSGKRMMVGVMAGLVIASGVWGETPVAAGEMKILAQNGITIAPGETKVVASDGSTVVGQSTVVLSGSGGTAQGWAAQRIELMAKEAGLSEEQVADIQKLENEKWEAINAWTEAYQAKSEEIRAQYTQGDGIRDKAAYSAAMEPLRQMREERKAIEAKYEAAIMKVLTKEQKARWLGYQLYQRVMPHFTKYGLSVDQVAQIRNMCDPIAVAIDEADSYELQSELRRGLLEDIEETVITDEQRAGVAAAQEEARRRREEQAQQKESYRKTLKSESDSVSP